MQIISFAFAHTHTALHAGAAMLQLLPPSMVFLLGHCPVRSQPYQTHISASRSSVLDTLFIHPHRVLRCVDSSQPVRPIDSFVTRGYQSPAEAAGIAAPLELAERVLVCFPLNNNEDVNHAGGPPWEA